MIQLLKKNRIYHMASMARSGETLMLKILAIHPNVKVIHNLDKEDDKDSLKAFQYLKKHKPKHISRKHKLIKPYKLRKKDVLLIKQGVWKHPYPFNGFVLSRNPVSIYSSLKAYDRNLDGYDQEKNFWFGNKERFVRWLKDIDPNVTDVIISKPPVEQFVDFYNLRMGHLLDLGMPIVRYEDLIANTESTLVKVCNFLDIPMDNIILNSHMYYDSGQEGHGQNDLSKPIDDSSLYKYKLNVTDEEFNFIKDNASAVYEQYGYKIESGEVHF